MAPGPPEITPVIEPLPERGVTSGSSTRIHLVPIAADGDGNVESAGLGVTVTVEPSDVVGPRLAEGASLVGALAAHAATRIRDVAMAPMRVPRCESMVSPPWIYPR
jgi:hypothetical protein